MRSLAGAGSEKDYTEKCLDAVGTCATLPGVPNYFQQSILMKKIAVASNNPAKLAAVRDGFSRVFPDGDFEIVGESVESGVSDQPMNDEETLRGALTRANNVADRVPDADYFVGLEGGIEPTDEGMEAFAWIVVRGKDGTIGKGRTGVFFLPPAIEKLIHEGKELGEADDIVFNKSNSKQSNGAVGILTGNVITRSSYYSEAMVFALIPFQNPELYPATHYK